jgi:hypothetical protein
VILWIEIVTVLLRLDSYFGTYCCCCTKTMKNVSPSLPTPEQETWYPSSPLPYESDFEVFHIRTMATIEKLPIKILKLIFNELAWTSLANVIFSSNAFTKAAFGSAALKVGRPMIDVLPLPEPVVVDVDEAPELEVITDGMDAGVELEFIELDHGTKRKLDEIQFDLPGEVVRVIHQRLLTEPPEAVAKRQQIQLARERADTQVYVMQATQMQQQAMPQYHQQPHSQMGGHPTMMYQQMVPAQFQHPGYVQHQPVMYQQFGHQQHLMAWNNGLVPVNQVNHRWYPQQQQPPALQPPQHHYQQNNRWVNWSNQW